MYISPIGRSAFTEVGKNIHDLYISFIYAHLLNSMRIPNPMESVVLYIEMCSYLYTIQTYHGYLKTFWTFSVSFQSKFVKQTSSLRSSDC